MIYNYLLIFNEESDGVVDFPGRKLEPLKHGHFGTHVGNDGKLIFPDLIKEYSGDI